MNIGEFSIRRKHLMLALMIGILIFGIYSRFALNTQLAPETNPPMVTVVTQYPGAAAQDVVTDVVEPLEDVFGTLDGIQSVRSTSQDNIAIIQLEFAYSLNTDEAAVDAQNAISRVRESLPDTIHEPSVLKFSTADVPILEIGLFSESMTMQDIRYLADDEIAYRLQLVSGVAAVDVFGGNEQEVTVQINPSRMAAYGLSLEQVAGQIRQNNIQLPGGQILHHDKEILIRMDEGYTSLDQLKRTFINLPDGGTIYLQDIADVNTTTGNNTSRYHLDGEEAIALQITKRADDNTIQVIDNVMQELELLDNDYPVLQFEIAKDDSVFTSQMVNNMSVSVMLAILFTVIVILLFIGNISQSLVVSISMPLVFLSTLALMQATGMELDMVTLSALILSIGFVVDAAIVVVENIISHHANGQKAITEAAIDGVNEIVGPSISGATTTVIVLVPLLFIEGFVGEMFRPLSLTLLFAITSSLIIALTIIPMLTVLMNRFQFTGLEKFTDRLSNPFNRLMDCIMNFYLGLMKTVLRNKKKAFLILAVLMIASVAFMAVNGLEMLPLFDSGVTYITIEMEPGTPLAETTAAVEYIEALLKEEQNVASFNTQIGYEQGSSQMGDFGIMGTNQAMTTVTLSTRKERKESIWEFQERIRSEIEKIPDLKRYVVKEQGGTAVTGTSAPLDLRISGSDPEVLDAIADDMLAQITEVPGTTNVYKSIEMDQMEINLVMNEARILELGLNKQQVASGIYTTVEGIQQTSMNVGEITNLDLLVGYGTEDNDTIDRLLDRSLQSPVGVSVPIRELVRVETGFRSGMLTREDAEHTVNINGFTHERAFSHIVRDINRLIDDYPIPAGYSMGMAGEQEALGDSMQDMLFLLALAIIFVYLVLVPQFKSFLHPLTIMMAIPLVLIGIAPALALTNKYISMPVLLGIILLAGTVVNNAILLIDNILFRRQEGVSVDEAVHQAIKARFRPIMMTAFSDVAGMMPLAMQLALGSERFSPLAIAVIGGIIAATFLTTIVVPLIYVSFEESKILKKMRA